MFLIFGVFNVLMAVQALPINSVDFLPSDLDIGFSSELECLKKIDDYTEEHRSVDAILEYSDDIRDGRACDVVFALEQRANRVQTRASDEENEDDKFTDSERDKCLKVLEDGKKALESETYENLKACYNDKECFKTMGLCQ